MKALSVRQPWAFLLVHGHKDVENRTWPIAFRGRLLIHASLTIDREAEAWVREEAAKRGIAVPDPLPTGGIVGEVTVVDCVTESDSEWFDGPYGFVVKDAKPLPLRKCKGKLGLFDVPYP